MKDKQISDDLINAILSLETKEECRAFLEDICTISELRALSQRLEVARLLKKDMIYSDIMERTGASSATVSRVARCINYGPGGYSTALDRIEDKHGQL